MIETKKLTKRFGDIPAVDRINARIQDANVFGLIGTNGAGKSTFLRLLCGILKPEEGCVLVDGSPVYENEDLKRNIFYISDDQHYLAGSTPEDMVHFCSAFYPDFDRERAFRLFSAFGLDRGRKITTFSKGMKKQLSVILGLCSRTRYLLCDETFDGLDPVIRNLVKSVVCQYVEEDGMTVIVSSHSLKELEGLCDCLGLLYGGKMVFTSEVSELQSSFFKVQVAFSYEYDESTFDGLNVLKYSRQGVVSNLIIKGDREEAMLMLNEKEPVILEIVPMSLEEVFTYELGSLGYSFDTDLLINDGEDNEK